MEIGGGASEAARLINTAYSACGLHFQKSLYCQRFRSPTDPLCNPEEQWTKMWSCIGQANCPRSHETAKKCVMQKGVRNCTEELKAFEFCSAQFWNLLNQPKVIDALTHLKRSEDQCSSLRRDLQLCDRAVTENTLKTSDDPCKLPRQAVRQCFASRFAGAEWTRYENCIKAPDADDEICGNEYEDVRAAFFAQGDQLLSALNFSAPERLGTNLERNQKMVYAVLAGASLGGASLDDKLA